MFRYLQRFATRDFKSQDYTNSQIGRILNADYMGSAEFEFGSPQRAYRSFTQHHEQLEFRRIGEAHVLGTPERLKEFEDAWEQLLACKYRTKEYTNLHERFVAKSKPDTNFWMSVDGGLSSQRDGDTFNPQVALTDYLAYLQLFYLHMTARKVLDPMIFDVHDHRIGDMVYTGGFFEPVKVVGINDDFIVVRSHHKNHRRSYYDVYPAVVNNPQLKPILDNIYAKMVAYKER